MDEYLRRANEADALLQKLTERVASLEAASTGSSSSAAAVPAGMIMINPSEERITEPARIKLYAYMKDLEKDYKKMEEENKALKKKLGAAQKEISQLKKSKGGASITPEQAKQLQQFKAYINPMEKVTESLKKWRGEIIALQEERDALKKQVEAGAKGGGMNQEQITLIKEKLQQVRAEVVKYMKKQGEMVEEAGGEAAAPTTSLVKMTMDTIQDLKYYTVTTDLAELKKEWEEAELGELDDEDFMVYLNRKVRVIEIEEDDDTVNVRFDNHDTQWFPVGCLYKEVEGAAPAPSAGPTKVYLTMETIKERKHYYVTEDLAKLKAAWEEAELGELDDEDFQVYLGRKVYAIDLEEDDDTMNVRFDNHDTQWFPVSTLYELVEAVAPATGPNGGLVQMTPDTIKERKYYHVTKDMAELKKAWFEAELGELDDEDFEVYLGRKVYAIDIEEDDDTMNVRFDNHDTQWFPISTLYGEAPAKNAANGNRTKMSMDTIKERKHYFVTKDLAELKKLWEEAELGELDDDDFKVYLGRKVYAIDLEEDDDTMNVRFDNHDTQWFPVTALYSE